MEDVCDGAAREEEKKQKRKSQYKTLWMYSEMVGVTVEDAGIRSTVGTQPNNASRRKNRG